MARLIVRIKILPKDIDTDLDKLADTIKDRLPDGMILKGYAKEPIAFGLNALVIDFGMDDKEGQMDRLEDMLRATDGVSEIQVINLSRESASI